MIAGGLRLTLEPPVLVLVPFGIPPFCVWLWPWPCWCQSQAERLCQVLFSRWLFPYCDLCQQQQRLPVPTSWSCCKWCWDGSFTTALQWLNASAQAPALASLILRREMLCPCR